MNNKKFFKIMLTLSALMFNISSIISATIIPICTDSAHQTLPASVKSNFNSIDDGIVIAWLDERNNGSLYAQKIDLHGKNVWAQNGILLDDGLNSGFTSDLDYPQIFSNNSGGAIIIYRKIYIGSEEIYAQKVSNDGITLRTPINLSAHYGGFNFSPRAISKNNIIAIVWENFNEGDFNIQAQKIDFNCTKLWNEGVEVNVCDYLYDQRKPTIAVDENNCVFISWLDSRPSRNPGEFYFDLYANRLHSSGKYTEFGSEGKLIFSYGRETASRFKVNDSRQKVSSDKYDNIKKEFFYNHNLVTTDNNSIIIAIEEQINYSDSFIRVIRVNENLESQWHKIIDAYSFQTKPLIVADNNDGAFLLWNDQRNYGDEVYGMGINKSGITTWGDKNGARISRDYIKHFTRLLPSEKIINGICIDKRNIFLTWVTYETNQLFLSNIDLENEAGRFGDPLSVQNNMYEGEFTSIVRQVDKIVVVYKQSNDILASILPIESIRFPDTKNKIHISNYPNPFNPTTNINFSLSKDGWVKLNVYDITGRVVNTLINEYKPAGNYNVTFDARMPATTGWPGQGKGLPTGIYFCRIESNGFDQTIKITLIK